MATTKKYEVKGMTCAVCSTAVERSVKSLPGVESVDVNLLTNSMNVEYDDEKVSDDNIIKAVTDAGYRASLKTKGDIKQAVEDEEVLNPLFRNRRK